MAKCLWCGRPVGGEYSLQLYITPARSTTWHILCLEQCEQHARDGACQAEARQLLRYAKGREERAPSPATGQKGRSQPKGIGQTYTAAVRRDAEGREWIDAHTMVGSEKFASWYATERNDHAGPEWADANPVVRYVSVRLEAVE